jgi:hypothetical protein
MLDVFESDLNRFGVTTAVFLAFLREHSSYLNDQGHCWDYERNCPKGFNAEVDDDGFFLCTSQDLQKKCRHWTKGVQSYHIRLLKLGGYLEVKYKGLPKQRWLKLKTPKRPYVEGHFNFLKPEIITQDDL